MKFGCRKPSLMRSIKASTTASVNRAIKKAIIPGYGEKGMGVANPKKAVYNRLYHITTANPIDAICNSHKNSHHGNYIDKSISNDMLIGQGEGTSETYRKTGIHPLYRIQSKKIKTLLCEFNRIKLNERIVQTVERILKFEQLYYKRTNYSQDLYSFIIEYIEVWRSESTKQWVQLESLIASDIIKMLQDNLSVDSIIANLQNSYNKE